MAHHATQSTVLLKFIITIQYHVHMLEISIFCRTTVAHPRRNLIYQHSAALSREYHDSQVFQL